MLKINDAIEIERTYSKEDIEAYCSLADIDPSLVSSVPEPLIAAMYSDMLGTKLPGLADMVVKLSLINI